jgi:hypothetical protein
MHSIVNIPHANNKRAQLTASVDNDYAKVTVVDPEGQPPYNSCGVCDLYIGDHMFEDDKRDALRMIVAQAIVFAIERGRGAGYSQARADIRAALGIPGS